MSKIKKVIFGEKVEIMGRRYSYFLLKRTGGKNLSKPTIFIPLQF